MVSGKVPVTYLRKVSPAFQVCPILLASSGFSLISLLTIFTAASCASSDSGSENILASSSGGRFLKSSSASGSYCPVLPKR